MTSDRIKTHFAGQVSRAELQWWPFPHLYVTDALPDDIYRLIIERQPFTDDPGERYGHRSWTRRLRYRHYYDHRFHHDLRPGRRSLTGEPWEALGDALGDAGWMGRMLRDRFPEFFHLRFGDIDAIEHGSEGDFWDRLSIDVFLQRHEPGYQLDAHTDIPSRIATCVFNFPPGDGYEDAGTQLLAPIDPRWRCSGNLHHPTDGFRVVSTIPYAPNTCLVFFKTRHSFHSVSPAASTVPGGRFGLQLQLREPEDGAVEDLSVPDLVRNGQFRPSRIASLVPSPLRPAVRRLRAALVPDKGPAEI